MADTPPVVSKQPAKATSVPEPTYRLTGASQQEEVRLTAEQEIRLRCIEAAALAWSGSRYSAPAGHMVIGLAEDMIQKVLNG